MKVSLLPPLNDVSCTPLVVGKSLDLVKPVMYISEPSTIMAEPWSSLVPPKYVEASKVDRSLLNLEITISLGRVALVSL